MNDLLCLNSAFTSPVIDLGYDFSTLLMYDQNEFS